MNSYKSLIQHFRFSAAMATNQNEEFEQLTSLCLVEDLLVKHLSKHSVKIPAVR